MVEYHPQIMIQSIWMYLNWPLLIDVRMKMMVNLVWLDETGVERFRSEVVLHDGSHVFFMMEYEDKWSGKTIQFQIGGISGDV